MTPTVLISDPAGFNTQRVPINGVSWSTAIGQSGSLSAEVRSSDLVAYGLNGELRGHWIVCQHDDAGPWGGVIGDVQPNGDGTTEIAAESWESLFNATRMPKRSRPYFGPAGSVALNIITDSTRRHGTPIVERTADDLGLPVSLDLDGGDLRAALDSMADETGQEWWVDPETMAFHWGIRGRDLTGTVQLIEGRHLTADWRVPTSLDPVVNDLEAFPLNDRYQQMQTVRVENVESIGAVGRRQGSAGIAGGSHAAHIRGRAFGMVNELAAQGVAIEMDVLNVDRCWAWFREGDLICVLLPSISVRLTVRVMARSLDDGVVMGVAGIVVVKEVLA